jgi:hypothetical protein
MEGRFQMPPGGRERRQPGEGKDRRRKGYLV